MPLQVLLQLCYNFHLRDVAFGIFIGIHILYKYPQFGTPNNRPYILRYDAFKLFWIYNLSFNIFICIVRPYFGLVRDVL